MVVEPAVLVVDDQHHRLVPGRARDHALDHLSDEVCPSAMSAGGPSQLPSGGYSTKCGSMNETLGSVPARARVEAEFGVVKVTMLALSNVCRSKKRSKQ